MTKYAFIMFFTIAYTVAYCGDIDDRLLRSLQEIIPTGTIVNESVIKGDFNKDGNDDIACIVRAGGYKEQKILIAYMQGCGSIDIGLFADAFTEPIGGGTLGVLPSLSWADPKLVVEEIAGSASAGWQYVFEIIFENAICFSQSEHKRENRNTGSFISVATDYSKFFSRRTLYNSTDSMESAYYNMIANYKGSDFTGGKIRIDKRNDIIYGNSHWQNREDLSAEVRSSWNDEEVLFEIAVVDNDLVFQKNDSISIQTDHVEIWFDTGEFEQDYMARTKPDKHKSKQFSFNPDNDGQVHTFLLYPQKMALKDVVAKRQITKEGYVLEIRLPRTYLDFRKEPGMETQAVESIGCTVVISDTDDPDLPKQEKMMATSSFRWGSPFHMGKLLLFKEYSQVIFPDHGF